MKRSKMKKGKLHQIFSRIFPVVMSVALVFGVLVSDYNQVKATGVEELLYYTYWDLISSLGYATGYNVDFNVDYDNSNTISGKDVWDAFCDFISYKPMADYEQDYIDSAMAELQALPNNATADGISISQDLYDWLIDVFGYIAGDTSSSIFINESNYAPDHSETPFHYSLTLSQSSGKVINCGFSVSSSSVHFVYSFDKGDFNCFCYSSTPFYYSDWYSFYTFSPSEAPTYYRQSTDFSIYNGYYYVNVFGAGDCSTYTPIGIRTTLNYSDYLNSLPTNTYDPDAVNSDISIPDIISSSPAAACPAEVPETIPWEVHPSIPDGWRIVDPNEDPEKQPDVLPGVIPFPIIPPGKDPDSTEDPDNTEDPESTQSPEVNPHPGIQINPVTGNEIDPLTGLDIDPETGYLIYPGTGQLINPETGEVIDPETGEVTSFDPVISGGYGDITKLFPFCIPFDLINLVKGMKADKSPPVFHFEFYFESINYNFVVDVDLTDYEKYIQIFRFGMQIFWIIALMFLTVKVSNLFV